MLNAEQLKALMADVESDTAEHAKSTNNTDKFGQAICAFANADSSTKSACAVKLLCMRPSQALNQHRDAVYLAAARYRVTNPRVFGSALHGDDRDGSDLDLLVDTLPGTTLFDLGGLQDELQELLGVSVEVLTPKDLPVKFRDIVSQEARPI